MMDDSIELTMHASGDYGVVGADEDTKLLKGVNSQLIWEDLTVTISGRKGVKKEILSNLNGDAKSGEILAIMGPSGAGKSTFLNCLAGKITKISGEISFWGKGKKASFAYVPQTDDLCLHLTVKESLMLSSQLKNHKKLRSKEEHRLLVDSFIKQFNLWNCAGNLVSKCSGGEAKRLSIALEMISGPSIVLLDEPTSGLDSSTAFKCIETLKNNIIHAELLKQPSVITTIHQPSSNLFNLFDKVYILTGGSCIYYGPPQMMVHYFSKFGIECPMYYNPADFALDIACNEKAAVEQLKATYLMANEKEKPLPQGDLRKIKRQKLMQPTPFFLGYWLLLRKFLVCWLREPHQVLFRLVEYLMYPIIIASLVDLRGMKQSACMFLAGNSTHVLSESMFQQFHRQKVGMEGLVLIFFNSFFNFVAALFPGILTFGIHINVFFKEHLNNWYSVSSFFFAFITVNALFSSIFASINSTAVYYIMSEQFDVRTCVLYALANIMTTFIGDASSLLLSIINPKDQLSSVVFAGIITFVFLVLCGILIKFQHMFYVGVLVSFTSCFRFIFVLISKILYFDSSCDMGSRQFNFNQVMEMLDFYGFSHNETYNVVQKMPCSVMNSLREDEIWNKTKIFEFAETLIDFKEDGISKLESFWTKSANYIALDFEIKDMGPDGILKDFTTLIVLYLVYNLLAFIALYCRASRRK